LLRFPLKPNTLEGFEPGSSDPETDGMPNAQRRQAIPYIYLYTIYMYIKHTERIYTKHVQNINAINQAHSFMYNEKRFTCPWNVSKLYVIWMFLHTFRY
jgi:hypothetical protein